MFPSPRSRPRCLELTISCLFQSLLRFDALPPFFCCDNGPQTSKAQLTPTGFILKFIKSQLKILGFGWRKYSEKNAKDWASPMIAAEQHDKKAAPHGSNRADPHMSHTHTHAKKT